LGEASLGEAYAAAHQHQIPPYTFPDEAIAALGTLHKRAQWTGAQHPHPSMPPDMNVEFAQSLLEIAKAAGRQTLDAEKGQTVLQAAGIAVPQDRLATSPDEAAAFARQIGFPVALKLISPEIIHKTDVGGVLLSIADEAAVREGFQTLLARGASHQSAIRVVQVQQMIAGGQEVIVGIKRDPTFGALVMFGMGGIYAEALADVSFRLAPLSRTDAEEMIAEVRSARILTGLRGSPPADREALIDALIRVSWLAHACSQIGELDINPLLVLPDKRGVVAVDIRLVLH
jgi:acetyltransferase